MSFFRFSGMPNSYHISNCLLSTTHQIDLFSLTETWLQDDEYVSLNESTPPSHSNYEFLRDLVLRTDKVIIVDDFNIHTDVSSDSVISSYMSLLDSIGFSQNVNGSSHCFNHTSDLVLTYDIETEGLTIYSHNSPLSDNFSCYIWIHNMGLHWN